MQFPLSFAHANHLIKQIQLNDKLTAYELVCLCARVCLCVRVYRWQHFFAAVYTDCTYLHWRRRWKKFSQHQAVIYYRKYIYSVVCVVCQNKQTTFVHAFRTNYLISFCFVYFGFTKEIPIGLKYKLKLKIEKSR